jgi:signal transduction histidine kinase
MLQRVLEITCETLDAMLGVVLLRDLESDLLRVEATLALDESLRGEFSVEMGQGFATDIVRTGDAEMVIDARRDSRINYSGLRKAKAVWGVPLKYEGKTIGALIIGFNKPYEWLPTERELLRAIADRSALAVHRARMTEAVHEREARIAELSAHLLRVQEEERKRISRELHDETGQGLMVIRLYLSMLSEALKARSQKEKINETIAVVDRTVDGIRRIIGHLSPLTLQELGLFAALRKEARDLEATKGVKTRVAISDAVGRLSPDTETAIYRIVQEALHNISKHAKAQHASITMERENGFVRLFVEDDGVGIFPKSNFRGNSFGLAGIKERVGMLGGEVRVISFKGKGTRIELTVPATEPANDARNGSRSRFAGYDKNEGVTHAKDQMSTH